MKNILVSLLFILYPCIAFAELNLLVFVDPTVQNTKKGDSAIFNVKVLPANLGGSIASVNITTDLPRGSLHWEYHMYPSAKITVYTDKVDIGFYTINVSASSVFGKSATVRCRLTITGTSGNWKLLSDAEAKNLNHGISKDSIGRIIGFSHDSTSSVEYAATLFEYGTWGRYPVQRYAMSFLKDRNSHYWHIFGDSMVAEYSGYLTFYKFPPGERRHVRTLAIDKRGDAVVLSSGLPAETYSAEICKMSQGNIRRICKPTDDSIFDNFEFGALCIDSSNGYWLSAVTKGIHRFSGTSVAYFSTAASQPTGDATLLQCDKYGRVWVASGRDSLSVFSIYDGTKWQSISGNRKEMKNLISLDFDSKSGIWCGTNSGGQGLWHFDGTNWKNYSTKNSLLPSNDVRQILIDNYDNVWLVLQVLDSSKIVIFNPNGLKGMTPPASSGEMPDVTPAFEVFPQPADETVTIQWSIPADELIVYNAFGRVALWLPLAAETSRTFSVSGLMNGVYFCRVGNMGGQIIINR